MAINNELSILAVEIMMVIKLFLYIVFKYLVGGVIAHFMYNNEQARIMVSISPKPDHSMNH
jgi:predicted Na+-dependent transporter